jgi:hypothetical protein
VGVYLFRKITIKQLTTHLKEKCVIGADVTRRMIMDKLTISDADLEIETTEYKISLQCPLMKFRLQLPGRSSECRHAQCFDLESFLMMNEKKPTWLCPVCDKYLAFDTLVVDSLMQEILQQTGSDVEEVIFNKEGEWTRVGGKEAASKSRQAVTGSSSSTSLGKAKDTSITENLLSDNEDETGANVSGSSSANTAIKTNDDLVNICGKYIHLKLLFKEFIQR